MFGGLATALSPLTLHCVAQGSGVSIVSRKNLSDLLRPFPSFRVT
jgi:hypothetical protein